MWHIIKSKRCFQRVGLKTKSCITDQDNWVSWKHIITYITCVTGIRSSLLCWISSRWLGCFSCSCEDENIEVAIIVRTLNNCDFGCTVEPNKCRNLHSQPMDGYQWGCHKLSNPLQLPSQCSWNAHTTYSSMLFKKTVTRNRKILIIKKARVMDYSGDHVTIWVEVYS